LWGRAAQLLNEIADEFERLALEQVGERASIGEDPNSRPE
jgi:hypothetical protein